LGRKRQRAILLHGRAVLQPAGHQRRVKRTAAAMSQDTEIAAHAVAASAAAASARSNHPVCVMPAVSDLKTLG
jgi:hypothetical protein